MADAVVMRPGLGGKSIPHRVHIRVRVAWNRAIPGRGELAIGFRPELARSPGRQLSPLIYVGDDPGWQQPGWMSVPWSDHHQEPERADTAWLGVQVGPTVKDLPSLENMADVINIHMAAARRFLETLGNVRDPRNPDDRGSVHLEDAGVVTLPLLAERVQLARSLDGHEAVSVVAAGWSDVSGAAIVMYGVPGRGTDFGEARILDVFGKVRLRPVGGAPWHRRPARPSSGPHGSPS